MPNDGWEKEYSNTIVIPLEGRAEDNGRDGLLGKIRLLSGIVSAELSDQGVLITYVPEAIDPLFIQENIKSWGFTISTATGKKKRWYSRLLESIAKDSALTLGSEPLDCCRLNKKN